MPEIEIGITEITVIIGIKMKRDKIGMLIDRPFDNMKTDTIFSICMPIE